MIARATLLLLTLGALAAQAQVTVDFALERSDSLLYEPIQLIVQVTNDSPQPVEFPRMSPERAWLDMLVTTPDQVAVPRSSRPWLSPKLLVLPGETRAISVNITPLFLIRETGDYIILVQAFMNERRLGGRTLKFRVTRGVTVWKQSFTSPADPAEPSGRPQARNYSLVVHRSEGKQTLYARIMDPEEQKVYCTSGVGPMLNLGTPSARVDRQGNLHVFHQTGSRIFTYVVFSPKGKVLSTRSFANMASLPSLEKLADDEVEVVGGEEIVPDRKDEIIPTAPAVATPPKEPPAGRKK